MSQSRNILTSLDIGTAGIKVIIAEIVNHDINVIGVSTQPSSGIRKGVIVDIDQTVRSIRQAVQEAERKADLSVEELVVGIPSYGLSLYPTRGLVKIADPDGEISSQDIENVISQAMIQAVAADQAIMGLKIKQFILDGFDDIADPRGMVGLRLELEADIYAVPKTILHSIKKCVSMAGLTISHIVTQPDALAAVALNHEQKQHGSIIMDMGAGQTTAAVYKDKKISYSTVDPEGGEFVSRDLSVVLNTTLEEAERIKINYGYAHPADANPDSKIAVNVLSQKGTEDFDEEYIVEIIHARLLQILTTVRNDLEDQGVLDGFSEVVVSGGNAAIPGLKRVFEAVFDKDFVLFIPQQMGVRYPTFSTALGLIQYVSELDDVQWQANSYINQLNSYGPKPKVKEPVQYKEEKEVEDPLDLQASPPQHETNSQPTEDSRKRGSRNQNRRGPSFLDRLKEFLSGFFD